MSVTVVVPTYNEVENLEVLVERFLPLGQDVNMLCVDDDSPDGTGRLAEELSSRHSRFSVIHRAGGARGYAPSSIQGLAEARRRGADYICTMDADLSHDPRSLPQLVSRAREGFDLVIGSRYIEGGSLDVSWGRSRRAISRAGSAYAGWMLGTDTRDCTSGFRCYSDRAVDVVLGADIASDGYSFLVEALRAVALARLPIAETSIRYVDRERGTSKIDSAVVLEALWRTTGLGVRRLFAAGATRGTASGQQSHEDPGP